MKTIYLATQSITHSQLKSRTPVGQVHWLCFFTDTIKRRELELSLDTESRMIPHNGELDEIAAGLRVDYTKWVDEISLQLGDSVDWWMGSIAGRSPFSSNLFLFACYLEYLKRIVKRGVHFNTIIAENSGLAQCIKKFLNDSGFKCIVINKPAFTERHLFYYLKAVYHLLYFIVISLKKKAAARKTVKIDSNNWIQNSNAILLDLFIMGNTFTKDGEFTDKHYYPWLYQWLEKKNIFTIIHPTLSGFHSFNEIYKTMRQSKKNFLIQEDHLGLRDYLYALGHPRRLLKLKFVCKALNGINIGPIVREEHIKYLANPLALDSLLKTRLLTKLKLIGLKPDLIIDWHENQVFDKALNIGAKQAFPNVPVVGAHLYIPYFNFLHLFPSPVERKFKVIPDVIAISGRKLAEVHRIFDKQLPLRLAPAFRYPELMKKSINLKNNFKKRKKKILVSLPIGVEESIGILDMLVRAYKQLEFSFSIQVTKHPGCNMRLLEKSLANIQFPDEFLFIDKKFSEAVAESCLLISSGSGTCIEAAALGIPVVIIGSSSSLSNNPMEIVDSRIWRICYNPDELNDAIRHFSHLNEVEVNKLQEVSENIRSGFFEPVSEEGIQNFINPIMTNAL